MTLISATENPRDGYVLPIIVGDILISYKESNQRIVLPTFLEGINEVNLKNQPIGLNQKVYVINDKVAVALSGSVFLMKQILEDIRDFFKWKEVNEKNLRELANLLVDYDLAETSTSFLIHIQDLSNRVQFAQFGLWGYTKTKKFGLVRANASGTDDFLNFISEDNLTTEIHSSHYHTSICNHLILMGKLIMREKISLVTIKKAWGAAYEIIAMKDGKFQKVDNIKNILISVELNIKTGRVDLNIKSLYNNKYYSEILHILVYDFEYNITKGFTVESILNTCKVDIDDDWTKREFDINKICITFHFIYSTGDHTFYSMVPTPQPFLPTPLSFKIKEINNLEVKLHPNFQNFIIQIGWEYYRNESSFK